MSIDFDVCCDMCRVRMHAGQVSALKYSFGYSSLDEDGRESVARFAFTHAFHGNGARVVVADTAKRKPSDDYKLVEYG